MVMQIFNPDSLPFNNEIRMVEHCSDRSLFNGCEEIVYVDGDDNNHIMMDSSWSDVEIVDYVIEFLKDENVSSIADILDLILEGSIEIY